MTPERQLVSVRISNDADEVKIKFREIITKELEEGQEENQVVTNDFTVTSKNKPHKDFIDSLKKLRKFGLAALEINLADDDGPGKEQIRLWSVLALKFSGDVIAQQSRVVMTLGKYVKRTKKVSEIKTGQITMYPQNDDVTKMADVDKMTAIVEDVIEECWSYLDGKYADEDEGQLPLFAKQTAAA